MSCLQETRFKYPSGGLKLQDAKKRAEIRFLKVVEEIENALSWQSLEYANWIIARVGKTHSQNAVPYL